MPWKESTKVSERAAMVKKWKSGSYSIEEIAEEFGVSRPTVYLWIRRAEEEGPLTDRRPTPGSCPHRTADAVVEQIIALKREFPHWGPRKIIDRLALNDAVTRWPAPSTAGRILEAHQLVQKRRNRRRSSTVLHAHTALGASESGEMMTVDHKGQFRLGNSSYCYPLTINDPVSRFVYAIGGCHSTSQDEAKLVMERVFREYGVPQFIGSDNGGPFCCSRAIGGLSRLSAWWIRLGVTPVRIHPGCPWENGIHERMHRTLKAYTTKPPAMTMRGQQLRFDQFRREFNEYRPHNALGGTTPQTHLKKCAKPYPTKIPPVEYPGQFEVRRVRTNGEIKWRGEFLFVSETLAGECLGLNEIADGLWAIHYAHLELCRFNERTHRII